MRSSIFSASPTPAAFRFLAALLLGFALLAGLPASGYAAGSQSPLGLWKTFDDKTGMPRALVRIYLQDEKYFGRIEQTFTPGAETRVCLMCKDDRKNQPIIGLLIIRNITLRDGEYGGGDILDPESGSVYRCKFHLENDGSVLVVRGFIGFSLLGRSQTWRRQD
ncbi:MAG: DUF2147 domain-containing protein [Gammaproteobacteria bacterium]